ncbi:MAG: hypothetical protein IPM13_18865 [Phycisphaerales bacterium]|nr:hypothetical protein [Phycisphaerales bacterium]
MLWVLGVLAALGGVTVGVAAVFVVVLDVGPTAASFLAAALVAVSLGLYGECYQRWARAFWGAPFNVGDRVRIVRGPVAGVEATVVGLGKALRSRSSSTLKAIVSVVGYCGVGFVGSIRHGPTSRRRRRAATKPTARAEALARGSRLSGKDVGWMRDVAAGDNH